MVENQINTKTNVLVEHLMMIPSVEIGVLQQLEPFKQNGICDVRFVPTLHITTYDIAWCDILITVRGIFPENSKIAKAAKIYGKFVIYYLDDDLCNVPQNLDNGVFSTKQNKTVINKCLTIVMYFGVSIH